MLTASCSAKLDHVSAVGFGVERGTDYWKVIISRAGRALVVALKVVWTTEGVAVRHGTGSGTDHWKLLLVEQGLPLVRHRKGYGLLEGLLFVEHGRLPLIRH